MERAVNHPDLQIDWLRALVAVVDAGSLSAAAPLLHRSQAAVSMQIKKLETALGQPVLLRGPRHLQLTPAGAELLGYARRMLELQAQAQAALFGPDLSGRVRLGVPDDYASTYLTPVLRSFAGRYQGVEIELTCEQSTALIPQVVRGTLDLALLYDMGLQRAVALHPVGSQAPYVLMPAGHALAQRASVALRDLAEAIEECRRFEQQGPPATPAARADTEQLRERMGEGRLLFAWA